MDHPEPRTTWTPRLSAESAPLYLAIADAIANDVRSGRLAAGTRLPTHRALAAALDIDVTTVTRAYAEAHRRGLVVGQVGRGTYVRGRARAPLAHPRAATVDLTVNLPPEPSDVCDAAMRRSLAELSRAPSLAAQLGYAPIGGSMHHRDAGRVWCAARGVPATAERVIVCAGAQQAITAALSAQCEPGDVVLTEAVTYPGVMAAARMLRLRVVGVAMDEDGLLPDALAHACRAHRPKVLLTTTTLHNPTATVMPVGRRRRIASVLRDRGLMVLEDDVYAPLVPDAPRPLATLVPELAYYVTSFSKTVSPALRTAYVIAPSDAAVTRLLVHLHATGWMAPALTMEVASQWIASGVAEQVIAERRTEATVRNALVREHVGHEHRRPRPHGFHHWLELPPEWRAPDFVDALRHRGVLVTSGDAFAVDATQSTRAIRLSLGAASDRDALAGALAILASVLREEAEPARPPF